MKKTLVFSAILFAVPAFLFAAQFKTGDQVSVRMGETTAEDLYMAGGTVTQSGTVTGDLYAGGGKVLVNGLITQDLTAGGGDVTVIADVGDDIRIGGGNVIIQGKVGGDVLVLAGSVRVEGAVTGDITVAGGDVVIDGPVGGSVDMRGQKLILGSGAKIAGNLTYKTPEEVVLEAGASVGGVTSYEPTVGEKKNIAAFVGAFALLKLFMTLAGAFALGLLLRRFSREVVAVAYNRTLMEVGRGFILLVAIPVASALLLVSIVGIPLGILGLLSYAALMIVACIMAPIILGSVLYKQFFKGALEVNSKTIVLGVLVYFVLSLVPVLGWIVNFALMLLALGSIATLKWSVLKEWR